MEKVNQITSNNYSVIEDFIRVISEKYLDMAIHFRIVPWENIKSIWTLDNKCVYKDSNKDVFYYPIKVVDFSQYKNKQELIMSILTQMALAYGSANGIQVSSRGGSYKNKKFKQIGEKIGLIFSSSRQDSGQIPVGVKQEILNLFKEEDLKSIRTYSEHKANNIQAVKGNSIKYICPVCQSIIRSTKKSIKDICGNCYEKTGKIVYREVVS